MSVPKNWYLIVSNLMFGEAFGLINRGRSFRWAFKVIAAFDYRALLKLGNLKLEYRSIIPGVEPYLLKQISKP
jgi:hypothetical protein